MLQKFIVLFYFLLFYCFVSTSFAQSYQQSLIQQAQNKTLWQDPYWHLLVRYQPSTFGGVSSYITSSPFFLAKDGKTNPQAEMEATIQAFFKPVSPSQDPKKPESQAQCRFPARFHWLSKKLNIDTKKLPKINCPLFTKWKQALSPKSVTIIFPAYDIARPGSMFGHVSLRFDSSNVRNPMLDFATNYGAQVNENNAFAISLAVRGLFGGYSGDFSFGPYYVLLRDYVNSDLRDIWEYQLNLTPKQISRLVNHLWEVHAATSNYLFTARNCASELLMLLDGADPKWNLRKENGLWITPKEAVNAILSKISFNKPSYVPSRYSAFKNKLIYMSDTEKSWFYKQNSNQKIIESADFQALPALSKARIFDAQIDAYILQQNKAAVDAKRALQYKRAALHITSPTDKQQHFSTPPNLGHKTQKLSVSLGYGSAKRTFSELYYRPSFHDMLDNPTGFSKDNSLAFFETFIRFQKSPKVRLNKFNLISAKKIRPYDSIMPSIAWLANFGWQTDISLPKKQTSPYFNVDAGFTYKTGSILWLVMADSKGVYNCQYDYCHQVGSGIKSAALLNLKYARLFVDLQNGYYFLGDRQAYHQINIKLAISTPNSSELRLEYLHYNHDYEAIGRWGFYF